MAAFWDHSSDTASRDEPQQECAGTSMLHAAQLSQLNVRVRIAEETRVSCRHLSRSIADIDEHDRVVMAHMDINSTSWQTQILSVVPQVQLKSLLVSL